MARLDRLRVYPIKALDGIERESARILPGGTLEFDRTDAMFDADGDRINGKRTARVHDIRTDFDLESDRVRITTSDGTDETFDLTGADRDAFEAWLGDFFDLEVTLRRDESLGFVDRRELGPSVISTATIQAVASWFDEVSVESARRRLRANVEISGVPAFWEDQFLGPDAPALRIGDVRLEGATPCGRCIVPQRDPDTGAETPDFRTRFIEKREETFPDWADRDAFDHLYTVMIISHVPEQYRGRSLTVGDDVAVVE